MREREREEREREVTTGELHERESLGVCVSARGGGCGGLRWSLTCLQAQVKFDAVYQESKKLNSAAISLLSHYQ